MQSTKELEKLLTNKLQVVKRLQEDLREQKVREHVALYVSLICRLVYRNISSYCKSKVKSSCDVNGYSQLFCFA